ncbi:CopD family protein [Bordetella genomosp. 13]|uniref:CopD family protein n=1 Tax=Bordetella genomosp. 13 TaxID=463040 RepID=UPI0011A17AF4|nr:CopD family protein [Bordetella genomosp. 13]
MAWLMALHIAALTVWSAALLYLPVMFSVDQEASTATTKRLRVMSRFAFVGLASPAAVLAILSGSGLAWLAQAGGSWLAAKLSVVALMACFHVYCGRLLAQLGHEGSHKKRRRAATAWLIVVPLVLIPTVLWLVLAKPTLVTDAEGTAW